MKKNDSANATTAGFLYQNLVSLYYCLDILNKDIDSKLYLQIDYLEDFAVLERKENKHIVKSLHQVKNYKDCSMNKYKKASKGLQENSLSSHNLDGIIYMSSDDIKCYLHVAKKLSDKNISKIKRLYPKVEVYKYDNSDIFTDSSHLFKMCMELLSNIIYNKYLGFKPTEADLKVILSLLSDLLQQTVLKIKEDFNNGTYPSINISTINNEISFSTFINNIDAYLKKPALDLKNIEEDSGELYKLLRQVNSSRENIQTHILAFVVISDRNHITINSLKDLLNNSFVGTNVNEEISLLVQNNLLKQVDDILIINMKESEVSPIIYRDAVFKVEKSLIKLLDKNIDGSIKFNILKVLSNSKTEESFNKLKLYIDVSLAPIYLEENKYHNIYSSLLNISFISNRLPKESFDALLKILEDLKNNRITLDEEPFNTDYYRETIVKKIFEIFSNIKYELTEEVVQACIKSLNLSSYTNKEKSIISEILLNIVSYDFAILNNKKYKNPLKIQEYFVNNLLNKYDFSISHNLELFLSISNKLLISNIDYTESNGKSISFTNLPIMVFEDEKVRNQISSIRKKSLLFLEKSYSNCNNDEMKKSIISYLSSAKSYYGVRNNSATIKEVQETTLTVLDIFKTIIDKEESKELLQSIENSVFWCYFHNKESGNIELETKIDKKCLEIKNTLYDNEEFNIFRYLIGYESKFGSWEEYKETCDTKDSKDDAIREKEALRFVSEEFKGNEDKWKKRIKEYSNIKSNDRCTFPIFMIFLKELSIKEPKFIIDLLVTGSSGLERFFVKILEGLLESGNDLNNLYKHYIDKRLNLASLAFGVSRNNIDLTIIESLLKAIYESNDIKNLTTGLLLIIKKKDIISESISLFNKFIAKINSLDVDSELKNNWIYEVNYLTEFEDFCEEMDGGSFEALLRNIIYAKKLDHRWEKVFNFMINKDINRFMDSLKFRLDNNRNDKLFDDLSYSFNKVKTSLSTQTLLIIKKAKEWYLLSRDEFSWKYGNLAQKLIPVINGDAEQYFIDYIKENHTKEDLDFMYKLLLNHPNVDGFYEVSRELAKYYTSEDDYESIYSILYRTGVVWGKYGMYEAKTRKIEKVKPWLKDKNKNVRAFAEVFIKHMTESAEKEKQRADKEKAVDDYVYGEDD
jgi:hypothetical protein